VEAVGVPEFGGGGLLDSCCRFVLVLSFELDGCQHAKRGVPSLPVVGLSDARQALSVVASELSVDVGG